jgi:hypothetical protein
MAYKLLIAPVLAKQRRWILTSGWAAFRTVLGRKPGDRGLTLDVGRVNSRSVEGRRRGYDSKLGWEERGIGTSAPEGETWSAGLVERGLSEVRAGKTFAVLTR